jgi:HAD superfamily hydrolase (TIGR01549 family)
MSAPGGPLRFFESLRAALSPHSFTPRRKDAKDHKEESLTLMSKSLAAINTLIFDWDGTLVDSAHLGLAAYEKAFAELDFAFSQEAYAANYSPNWYTVYERLGLPQEKWEKADELWRRHYATQTAELVDGAGDVLMELRRRNYRLGVVTSGNEDRVSQEIEEASLPEIFDVVICAEHIANQKPHPEGLEIALNRLGCASEQAAYIGDAPEDILMGKHANVLTIGVRSNYPCSSRLLKADPDLYLERISDLTLHFEDRID